MNKIIGILGAGQLAQLLAQAATQIDLKTLCFAEADNMPAASTSPVFIGDISNESDLKSFANQVDVITFENENVPDKTLQILAGLKPVYPSIKALKTSQDRLLEKQFLQKIGIECASFCEVNSVSDIETAFDVLGDNIRIKTRTLGYDGKGQFALNRDVFMSGSRIKSGMTSAESGMTSAESGMTSAESGVTSAESGMTPIESGVAITDSLCHSREGGNPEDQLSILEHPCIAEGHVDFDAEVSILAVRSITNDVKFYPPIENRHEAGILRTSVVPSSINVNDLEVMHEKLKTLLEELDYVGLLAVEFFVKDGKLIANEMAPRVHNSGHLTIEAFNCSQFENHLRAVCGIEALEPKLIKHAQMTNIIGSWPDLSPYKNEQSHIYDYGKSARENRKLGHITTF